VLLYRAAAERRVVRCTGRLFTHAAKTPNHNSYRDLGVGSDLNNIRQIHWIDRIDGVHKPNLVGYRRSFGRCFGRSAISNASACTGDCDRVVQYIGVVVEPSTCR